MVKAMDKINQYQEAILSLLTDYAQFGKPGPGLETQIIADKERNHFQLLTVGWQNDSKFVYAIAFHLDIKDGKIWVYQNNTDAMIGDELMERGVAKNDIVLAFHAPSERKYTGFAVA